MHGAYQGGWIWQIVAKGLADAGHQVYHPSLDGCADRQSTLRADISTETHSTEIADLLFYEDLSEVILVGTSSGGMVVCAAGEQARDRIGRLVFVDALALDHGERIGDIVDRPPATKTELATGPSAEDATNRMFADLQPDLRTWAVERVTMHPLAVMEEPVKLDSFWSQSWPADVIYCRQSLNPPEPHQRRTAERLDASWRELDTGHYPMLSAPDELLKLLLETPT